MPPLNPFTRTCVALAIGQAFSVPVHSATVHVNDAGDVDGPGVPCTLREAIVTVNTGTDAADATNTAGCYVSGTLGPMDTITFEPARIQLAGGTVTLTQALPLVLTNPTVNLAIEGLGRDLLTISGNNNSRVFDIDYATVTLNSLTVANGSTAGEGGGIYCYSGAINLNHSRVVNNTGGNGGGLSTLLGSATIVDSDFSSNTASGGGGGIFSTGGNLSLSNSRITNNTATITGGGIDSLANGYTGITSSTIYGNSAVKGGGIYSSSGDSLTITSSTLYANYASNNGGGIYIGTAGDTSVINSTVSGNTAATFGGGAYVKNSTFQVSAVTISNNRAGTGGGGISSYGATATTVLVNSIVSGNLSDDIGHEIDNLNGVIIADYNNLFGDSNKTDSAAFSNFTPTGSDITATFDGTQPTPIASILVPLNDNGGETQTHLLVPGSPAIDMGDGPACLATDQRGKLRDDGTCDIGALEVKLATITVDSDHGDTLASFCTLYDAIKASNTSMTSESCIAGEDHNTIEFDSAVFPPNGYSSILLTNTLPTITSIVSIDGPGQEKLTISGNDSYRVFSLTDAMVNLNSLTVSNGSADNGAGIQASNSTLSLTGITLSNNTATSSGGAIRAFDGSISLTSSTISNNLAGKFGGGILASISDLTVNNSIVSDNVAKEFDGGGIRVAGTRGYFPDFNLTDSTVSGNSAGRHGGGIDLGDYVDLVLNRSNVSNNTAGGNGGGVYADYDDFIRSTDSTISGNVAMLSGGGIGITYSGFVILHGSTVSGNSAASSGGGISSTDRTRVYMVNSTLSDNAAAANGGGIYGNDPSGKVGLTNTTVSGNSASLGGGIFNVTGSVSLANSIISGNEVNDAESGDEVYGLAAVITADHTNLLGDAANAFVDAFVGFSPGTSDLVATSTSDAGGTINPDVAYLEEILEPLSDNGGPTLTRALLENSPARDAGDDSDCQVEQITILVPGVNKIDQRGEPRDDGFCDIGAYEFIPDDPEIQNCYVINSAASKTIVFCL